MPHPDRLHAVLWDLDGTLLDSRELHWLAWREVLAAEGHALTEMEFAATFGQRNDAIIPALLGTEVPASTIERIDRAKEIRYRRLVRMRGIDLLPGVEDWLERLRAAGWRQALATSAPRANVDTILEVLGIGDYFAAIAAAEDVTRGKPEPDVFLLAGAALAVPVYRCVVVEDSLAGIQAAQRAGMRCIGVGPNWASLPADLAVPTLAGLEENAFEWVLEHGSDLSHDPSRR